ncbi:hypothetical protein MNBD_GAMMA10-2709 [hydrothermal vent metagenome]|uniref:DUF642 domain-containing protein n=1 Tax=hydrothermal vent metagenome TaxID=652676 RepID=A0A3B0Y5X8_9ZZZZ
MKNIYSGILAATFFILCGNAASAPILNDNFDTELGSNVLNYNSFENWDVLDGTADIISNGGFGISCFNGVGKCVDLDGSSSNAGILISKEIYNFLPGTYELTFALSGNQRGGNSDSVTVSLGSIFSEIFTKLPTDPFENFTRTILVSDSFSANLVFNHAGNDNVGLILDNVSLTSVPVPPSVFLFLSGILGLGALKKDIFVVRTQQNVTRRP